MKKPLKRCLLLCMALIMLFALCACGTQQTQTSTQSANVTGTNAPVSKTRVITDILGRKVEIPSVIEKADCQGSAARMMVYAGAVDKIAGLTEMEIAKDSSAVTLASAPHAYVYHDKFASCAATSSGWPKFETYYEEIIALNPDVIILFGSDMAACDKMQKKVGIPVVGIYATSMLSQDFKDTLTLLGDIMGTSEHAAKVVTGLEGYLKDLNDRTASIPKDQRPTVYAGAVSFKGYNGFDGTYADFPVFQAINANNVVDEVDGTGAMMVDLEKVSTWDPKYIFINCEPESLAIVKDKYAADPSFYNNLSAVKNGKLYTLAPFNWYNTNMEIALVDAYWVASVIYPEQFTDVNFAEKADEIFNLFLGCDYLSTLKKASMGYSSYTLS